MMIIPPEASALIKNAITNTSEQISAATVPPAAATTITTTTTTAPHRPSIHPLLLILLIPIFLIVTFYGSYVLPPVLAGGTFLVVTGMFFITLDSFLGDIPFGTVIALIVAVLAGYIMAQAVAGMAEPSTVILFAALGAAFGLILEPVFRMIGVVKQPSSLGIQMLSIIGFFTIVFGYIGQFVGLGNAAFLSTSYVGSCAAVESLTLLSKSFFGHGSVVTKHPTASEIMAEWFVLGATLLLGTAGWIFQKYCVKPRDVDTREYEQIG